MDGENRQKVLLLCGKLCSGKTHYARQLCATRHAVLLSADWLMQTLFPQAGALHDEAVARVRCYLLGLAVQLVQSGTTVVLDWGFWSRAQRAEIAAFFRAQGILCEWHYVYLGKTLWRGNIQKRNCAVRRARSADFYVDAGLFAKMQAQFEPPGADETMQRRNAASLQRRRRGQCVAAQGKMKTRNEDRI